MAQTFASSAFSCCRQSGIVLTLHLWLLPAVFCSVPASARALRAELPARGRPLSGAGSCLIWGLCLLWSPALRAWQFAWVWSLRQPSSGCALLPPFGLPRVCLHLRPLALPWPACIHSLRAILLAGGAALPAARTHQSQRYAWHALCSLRARWLSASCFRLSACCCRRCVTLGAVVVHRVCCAVPLISTSTAHSSPTLFCRLRGDGRGPRLPRRRLLQPAECQSAVVRRAQRPGVRRWALPVFCFMSASASWRSASGLHVRSLWIPLTPSASCNEPSYPLRFPRSVVLILVSLVAALGQNCPQLETLVASYTAITVLTVPLLCV